MSLHCHKSLKSRSLLSSAFLDELKLRSCLPNVSGYLDTQHTHTALDIYVINPLKPNDPYRGLNATLTSKVALYIFIQQIQLLNILKMVYNLRFFLFKM